ncbi:hypothetical protein QYF36_017352 [Acer negundo]|nr:hypothetical protein QYF36_017352 [Acer negundo]
MASSSSITPSSSKLSEAELTLRIANAISKKLDKDGEADGNKATGGQSRGEELNPAPKIKAEWFQWITAEQRFVATNFILELPSVVFDKLSSVHKPQYALLSMLMSFMTMLIGIIQLVYQGRKGRVVWKRREKLPWFYYPSPSDKPFAVGVAGSLSAWLNQALASFYVTLPEAALTQVIVDEILKELKPIHIEDIIEQYRVHKDEEALHNDIVNFKQRYYSGHIDEDAFYDDIVNFKKRYYSGHNDEEALYDAFANFIKTN